MTGGGTGAGTVRLDFVTMNTVSALTDGRDGSRLVEFKGEAATGAIFRSAMCLWEESG